VYGSYAAVALADARALQTLRASLPTLLTDRHWQLGAYQGEVGGAGWWATLRGLLDTAMHIIPYIKALSPDFTPSCTKCHMARQCATTAWRSGRVHLQKKPLPCHRVV
jgi:hypothetical protein